MACEDAVFLAFFNRFEFEEPKLSKKKKKKIKNRKETRITADISDYCIAHPSIHLTVFLSCRPLQCHARIQKFFKGGGGEENFERKMFVDTRINACTHKN